MPKINSTLVSEKTKKAALLVVALAVFTDMLIYGLVVPILPKYATSLGASQTAIGFLFSSYAITLFIATPIFGALSDKIGRKGPMLWGLLGLGTATILFAFADSFWLLVVARSLQGLAAAATWTAGLALLADLYPSDERGKIMGIALSGQAAGTLLGPTIGGWLYQLGDYRLPFLVAAGLAFIDGLLRLFLLKDVPHPKSEDSPSPFKVLRNRQLLIITGVIIIGASVPSVLEPTLPLHLQKVLSATPGVIGLLFAVPTLAYGLATPIIGTMSTRIGYIKAIIIGLIMVAIALPLVALPDMLWLQVCALAFLGISMGMVLAPCLPQLADISQKSGINSYGITFALYNTAYSIGMMIGPIASSTIADAFGLTISYMTIAAIVLLYMIFLTITSRSQS
ncbi:MFS transporter [Viridibacillus sp. YIM B01967]|uniref:MFS transporter n=2 Tax=Viridibacillus soli TaxID=2798301 RepID=A0ABS1HAQ7_9BACL|nr:MFS transporter [Viridibacillus soli]